MHLFHVFPILSILFAAHTSSLDSRASAAHPLDARDLLDVCASIDTNLVIRDWFGVLTAVGIIGQFNLTRSQPLSRVLNHTF